MKDVAQELFVAVHEQIARYDRTRPLRPWLFSFALRYAANYRRLARNQGHVSEEVTQTTEHGTAAESRDLVLRALESMPFDRRTVVVMHDLEGFDAPEIAAELGLPLNTVYSKLRTARLEFRQSVEDLQQGGSR